MNLAPRTLFRADIGYRLPISSDPVYRLILDDEPCAMAAALARLARPFVNNDLEPMWKIIAVLLSSQATPLRFEMLIVK